MSCASAGGRRPTAHYRPIAEAGRAGRRAPGASFRFHGELGDLLAPPLRGREFLHAIAENASLKHAIESLGVPHTEVGSVSVDGVEASLEAPALDGTRIDVFPAASDRSAPARFLADAHLGALARRLRLLGFDTRLATDGADHELAALAAAEDRIVLSRDRELLKHRLVRRGRYVRSQHPDRQLEEVAARFALRGRERPFSRCLECNGALEPVGKEDVRASLPPAVAACQSEFTRCAGCGRVYWPGTHWRRLSGVVESFRARP